MKQRWAAEQAAKKMLDSVSDGNEGIAGDLMTTRETADFIRSNENTLAFWRHCGKGPRWAKLGRRIVYRRSDVLAWLDEQFTESSGQAHSA